MGGDARSDSNIRYKRLLQLLSKHIPTLCFSKNGDPDTVFSLFIEPWFHASALAKTSNQTRLDAVEQELSQLQGLLGNIQAEFLLHLSQQQQVIIVFIWDHAFIVPWTTGICPIDFMDYGLYGTSMARSSLAHYFLLLTGFYKMIMILNLIHVSLA